MRPTPGPGNQPGASKVRRRSPWHRADPLADETAKGIAHGGETGRTMCRTRPALVAQVGGDGASDGTRNRDIQDHNLALYQLSYARHPRRGVVADHPAAVNF